MVNTLRWADTKHVSPLYAPQDCLVDKVTYVSGDRWNVNPIALNRIAKLFA